MIEFLSDLLTNKYLSGLPKLSLKINELIRDAERHLSIHLENVKVLYDSSKFYYIDISIKKIFTTDPGVVILIYIVVIIFILSVLSL